MKTTIVLLALIVCSISNVFAQVSNDRGNRDSRTRLSQINFVAKHYYKTKAAEMNLKDKVKSIREDEYEVTKKENKFEKAADIKNYSYYHTLTAFSETGDEVSNTSFNKEGGVEYSKEFTYLKPGMVSQRLNFDAKHQLKEKVTYEYDAKDYQVIETKFDNNGKLIYKDQSNYTFPSNNSYEREYIEDGTANPDKMKYTYNKDTLLSEERKLSTKGSNAYYKLFEYDDAQHIIKETFYISKAKGDEDANVIGYEINSIITYEYDANGNMTNKKSEYIYRGKSSFKTESCEYTYDAKGNWIKRLTSFTDSLLPSGNRHMITERQIKYY